MGGARSWRPPGAWSSPLPVASGLGWTPPPSTHRGAPRGRGSRGSTLVPDIQPAVSPAPHSPRARPGCYSSLVGQSELASRCTIRARCENFYMNRHTCWPETGLCLNSKQHVTRPGHADPSQPCPWWTSGPGAGTPVPGQGVGLEVFQTLLGAQGALLWHRSLLVHRSSQLR